MIVLTRLDGSTIALNEEQIERLDSTPTTVITMVNGNRYLVSEALDDVVDRVVEFQARVLARAERVTRTRPAKGERRSAHLRLASETPGTGEEN